MPEVRRERHRVSGEKLLQTVKRLVHEGNVRRIVIKNDEDRTILEIPLTIGVVGALALPGWVAIGAIAALAADYTIEVEKLGEAPEPEPAEPVAATAGAERGSKRADEIDLDRSEDPCC